MSLQTSDTRTVLSSEPKFTVKFFGSDNQANRIVIENELDGNFLSKDIIEATYKEINPNLAYNSIIGNATKMNNNIDLDESINDNADSKNDNNEEKGDTIQRNITGQEENEISEEENEIAEDKNGPDETKKQEGGKPQKRKTKKATKKAKKTTKKAKKTTKKRKTSKK
jgi:hypothetical protein